MTQFTVMLSDFFSTQLSQPAAKIVMLCLPLARENDLSMYA